MDKRVAWEKKDFESISAIRQMKEAGLVCQSWEREGLISKDEYEECKEAEDSLKRFMQHDKMYGEQTSLFESDGRKAIDLEIGMMNNSGLQRLAENLKNKGDTVFIRGKPDKSVMIRVFFK